MTDFRHVILEKASGDGIFSEDGKSERKADKHRNAFREHRRKARKLEYAAQRAERIAAKVSGRDREKLDAKAREMRYAQREHEQEAERHWRLSVQPVTYKGRYETRRGIDGSNYGF